VGSKSQYSNSSGNDNTSFGFQALDATTTGSYNTAIGSEALGSNVTGNFNTALGRSALANMTGSSNTALGDLALSIFTGSTLTAVGAGALVSNTGFINAAAIGANSIVNASNKVRIGNSSVTVYENATGSWTTSDGRFKYNVEEEVKGLEFINALRPVVYNFDATKFEEFLRQNFPAELKEKQMNEMREELKKAAAIRQTGFIAQEVEEAAKKTGYNFNGVHVPVSNDDNYSVSYEKFVVPLVKAVQEQQKMIKDQQAAIEALQAKLGSNAVNGVIQMRTEGENDEILLGQNVPNPFDQSTLIPFRIPSTCKSASIMIAETATAKVIRLVPVSCKETQLIIDAGTLAAGTYVYTLYIDGQPYDSKQMMIVK
jgi:hypothetical protein